MERVVWTLPHRKKLVWSGLIALVLSAVCSLILICSLLRTEGGVHEPSLHGWQLLAVFYKLQSLMGPAQYQPHTYFRCIWRAWNIKCIAQSGYTLYLSPSMQYMQCKQYQRLCTCKYAIQAAPNGLHIHDKTLDYDSQKLLVYASPSHF